MSTIPPVSSAWGQEKNAFGDGSPFFSRDINITPRAPQPIVDFSELRVVHIEVPDHLGDSEYLRQVYGLEDVPTLGSSLSRVWIQIEQREPKKKTARPQPDWVPSIRAKFLRLQSETDSVINRWTNSKGDNRTSLFRALQDCSHHLRDSIERLRQTILGCVFIPTEQRVPSIVSEMLLKLSLQDRRLQAQFQGELFSERC